MITLEPLREAHAAEMFALLSDERIWTYVDAPPPMSRETLAVRYRTLESQRSPDGKERWLNWIVRDEKTRVAVGFVQATVHEAKRSAAIAYVIGASFWNRGYARSATQAMLERLSSDDIDTFTATVDERNVHSIAVLERIGFQRTDQTHPSDIVYTKTHVRRQVPMPAPTFEVLGIDRSDYMVRDFVRAHAFYRDVMGFQLASGGVDDSGGEFELPDGATFGLWHGGDDVPFQPGNSVLFAVDDLDNAIAAVERRGIAILIRQETPVCNFATFHDSEGNTITLHKRKVTDKVPPGRP